LSIWKIRKGDKYFLASSDFTNYNEITNKGMVEMDKEKLAERLKKQRAIKDMTLEQVGKIIGVEKQTVFGWENGDNQPKYKYLVALADFYGVSTDYLLGITDDIIPKLHNLAEIFSSPTSPQYINKIQEMLDAGYSHEQISNFIDMTINVSKEKSRQ
jgi:transcriptional regulator with XRE-family HTH domain